MNFRITYKRVLVTGLVLSLIFVAFSASYTAHGSEPAQASETTKQRSRLHPKRIFSGLKRGVSKLFGRSKSEALEQDPFQPQVPRKSVGQEIDRIYSQQGIQQARPIQPPVVTRQIKRPLPTQTAPKRTITQPTTPVVKTAPQQKPAQPVKVIAQQPKTNPFTPKTRSTNPFIENNPFAEFDAAVDAEKVVKQDTQVKETVSSKADLFANDQPRTKQVSPVKSDTLTKQNPFAEKVAQQATTKVSRKVKQVSSQPTSAPEIKHLLGYCPVNLKQGKFLRGKQRYRHVHEGRTYLLDSLSALKEFQSNPAPYAPVLQGMDVVDLTHTGRHVEGYLSYSCDFEGRFYLFRTIENQEAFLANPSAYSVPE